MRDRFEVNIFGLVIGTADGWDEQDTTVHSYYNFEAANEWFKNANCINVDFSTGEIEYYDVEYDENGDVIDGSESKEKVKLLLEIIGTQVLEEAD